MQLYFLGCWGTESYWSAFC